MKRTKIQWATGTWNPWMGCEKVSPACKGCYMYRMLEADGKDPKTVFRVSDEKFNAPLKWEGKRLVFPCSMSDFFIDKADEWRPEGKYHTN